MKKFYINENNFLSGDINISGSKNSALSILSVSLLSNNDILIKNIPNISDVNITISILKKLGSKIDFYNNNCYINNYNVNNFIIPLELSKLIRSSLLIIPSLLIKFGKAITSFPGGCNFCSRPIDLHLKIFNKFGIYYNIYNDTIIFFLKKKRILGSKIIIEKISVGATINAISLSVLALGISIIENISIEPEVIDTINFLNNLGANINIIGYRKLAIIGVKRLNKYIIYSILPDRIETGTFLVLSAITKSNLVCYNTNPNILLEVINFLRKSGSCIKIGNDFIFIKNSNRPKSISLNTNPYPIGLPTDLQPQFTVLNSISLGESTISENVFKSRFSHVNELLKMNANISIYKNNILCKGVKNLFGSKVYAKDLRSSISLILAGLCSINQTILIDEFNYIDRGYENILEKLNLIGSNIIISNL